MLGGQAYGEALALVGRSDGPSSSARRTLRAFSNAISGCSVVPMCSSSRSARCQALLLA
jgi:hypothetical protein